MSDCTTRTCSDCGQEFPLTKEYFHRYLDKSGYFYFQHRCLACKRKFDREYNQANPEHARERSRRYRQNHPEETKAYKKQWYAANPDKVKAMKQRERKKNAEGYRQRGLKWRLADPERAQKRARENYHRMVDRHPGYIRQMNDRKYSNNGGPVDKELALQLYNEQEGHCGYCGISVYHSIKRDVHIEHILPRDRGGSNDPDNLLVTCGHCNWEKNTKTFSEWQAIRGW